MTKLCNILCTYEMAPRLAKETNKHITINAFNPGLMTDTNFMSPIKSKIARTALLGFSTLLSIAIGQRSSSIKSGQALATLVIEPQYKDNTAKYYDRYKEKLSSKPSYNKDSAKKLWIESAKLTQLKQDECVLSIY